MYANPTAYGTAVGSFFFSDVPMQTPGKGWNSAAGDLGKALSEESVEAFKCSLAETQPRFGQIRFARSSPTRGAERSA